MQNHTTSSFTKNIEAVVMGVLMFFVSFTFGSIAHAENNSVATTDTTDRAALLADLQAQREALEALRSENRVLVKDMLEQQKTDYQTERRQSAMEFRASITNLSPEEKRSAVMNFVADLQAQAEALRVERATERSERKAAWLTEQDVFLTSLNGKTRVEKLAALQDRLATLLQQASDRNDELTESDEEDDSFETDDDIEEDDSDDESDDSDDSEEDSTNVENS